MGKVFDTQTHETKVECPECNHEFKVPITLSIYEPSIDIDVE